ncbi:MAG: hypothetical protein WDZ60_04795, partial [Wenzhouxiangellaceae bacterium]
MVQKVGACFSTGCGQPFNGLVEALEIAVIFCQKMAERVGPGLVGGQQRQVGVVQLLLHPGIESIITGF